MKLPAFAYACPETLEEAVALLAAGAGTAKALSGGQSLLPTMAFRLVAPSLLVDLRKLPGLDRISLGEDGVRLGAKVRWRDIERDARLASAHPLLARAVAHVAHYQIRNRGTVGGNLAHADPAAEMPGVAVTCDAELALTGSKGTRVVRAADFFLGPLSTVLADDELIVEVRLPAWPPGRRWGFEEFALRRGDFALAGVAAYYDPDAEGIARNAHIGVIGACHRAHRLARAEAALNGRAADEQAILASAEVAAAEVDPPTDLHASAAYRRALVQTLLERALLRAAS
ncbi:MAG: FAD binding domain-containing protein [Betaproteobacteria bacterium]|nr:FAD binding domain-containing protein [Betaproteobacteria bacterium]